MNDKNRAGRPGSRRFEKALTFTTSLISRLDADPGAIDPTLYPIKNWESLLWALQQQYIKGPCERLRASKDYTDMMRESSNENQCHRLCFTVCGTNKLQKWENLGSMKKSLAAQKYVEIIERLAPGWDSPMTPETALQVQWTNDHASPCCGLCQEGFTFLNRRHHCRRCFHLVCAPCSSNRMNIRLSPGAPLRLQRVCRECVHHLLLNPTPAKKRGKLVQKLSSSADAPILARPAVVSIEARQEEEEDDDDEEVVSSKPFVRPTKPLHLTGDEGQTQDTAILAEGQGMNANGGHDTTNQEHAQDTGVETSNRVRSQKQFVRRGQVEMLRESSGALSSKKWETFTIVVLVRKATLGVFTNAADTTPAKVFRLTGCEMQVSSDSTRMHQLKILNCPSDGKSTRPGTIRLAFPSVRELNEWVATVASAIRVEP